MSVPWRIAAQAYTVLHPDTKEPLMTLQFILDQQQADVARLRIVPAGEGNEGRSAIEIEFSTGGYPLGAAWLQPRWLKAFERPMPVNGEQRVALAKRREAWAEGRHDTADRDGADGSFRFREPSEADLKAWEEVHGEPKDSEGNVIPRARNVGPDGVADGEERPGPDGKVVERHETAAAARVDAGLPVGQMNPQPGQGFAPVSPQGLGVVNTTDSLQRGMSADDMNFANHQRGPDANRSVAQPDAGRPGDLAQSAPQPVAPGTSSAPGGYAPKTLEQLNAEEAERQQLSNVNAAAMQAPPINEAPQRPLTPRR